jgi:hypothetical protein
MTEKNELNNPLRWMALVLLDEPQLPNFDDLTDYAGQHFTELPPITIAGTTDSLLTFSIGEYTAAITLIDKSVPWSQLEGPCATAWYWPTASSELVEHQAHLLVTLVDEGGKTIEKSTLLTLLVTAIIGTAPSCGVFWGPGRLVHPPQAFIDQALQLSAEDLPLFLWVDFRVERVEDGSLCLYTTGLEPLGYSEIEIANFQGQPQTLLEYAYNIAHYQVTQSKPINEGDTLGLTDELQAVAYRRGSMFDKELEVIALEFQAAGE